MYYSWIPLDYSLCSKQYLIFNYLKEELSVTVWTVNHLATAKTSPLPFVFCLLCCKVFLACQQFQPCQPAPKPQYPTEQTLPSHHMELSWGIYCTAEAVHRFPPGYQEGRWDLFSCQRIEHKLSEFAQVLLRLFHTHTHAHTLSYVKSWRTTLAGQKGTSTRFCFVFQSKMFIASVSFTKKPSQLRTLDSNNTRME